MQQRYTQDYFAHVQNPFSEGFQEATVTQICKLSFYLNFYSNESLKKLSNSSVFTIEANLEFHAATHLKSC